LKNLPARDKTTGKEFRLLKKDPEIREYFRFENSRVLKLYKEIAGTRQPDRYNDLLRETGSDSFRQKVSFLKDKKKLEKSETWRKYQQFKALEADEEMVFYRKFENSSLYKNFLATKDSPHLKRYNTLKTIVSSEEYLKRKAYLDDTKKWEKTEEYAKYQRFLTMKKNPKVETYFKFLNCKDFDFFKTWEVSFKDDFNAKTLDSSKWIPNSLWAERLLGNQHSQPGDLQAYTGGKNAIPGQQKLMIAVKKEKADSKFWSPKAGFVPATFNYTSDTLSTFNSFKQKGGIFEAKIRFAPVKQVVSSLYLLGENNARQLTLFEMGPRNRMGILSKDGSKGLVFKGAGIGSLQKNEFFIFGLHWEGNHFTWKINDKVIYETNDDNINFPVHLNLTSLVIDEVPASDLPVNFETAWITCYRKK
jgi:hypothetical protein